MITMKNICKTYKVAKRNAGFKEAARSFFRREYETVTALDDVSFTINDGETVGYIGPTGAEKAPLSRFSAAFSRQTAANVMLTGACRGRIASSMCGRSALYSDSARSFGGMCP